MRGHRRDHRMSRTRGQNQKTIVRTLSCLAQKQELGVSYEEACWMDVVENSLGLFFSGCRAIAVGVTASFFIPLQSSSPCYIRPTHSIEP